MVEYTLWDQRCQCSMFKFAWTKLSPPTEWSFSSTANPKEQFYYLQCCAFAYLRTWAEIVWEFSSVQLLLELWWRIVWGGNIKNSVDLHILTIGKSFWWIYSQNCKRFLSQEEKSGKINKVCRWSELGPRTKLSSSEIKTWEELRYLAVFHTPLQWLMLTPVCL